MWYLQLLYPLLDKMPEKERDSTKKFLDALFPLIKTNFYSNKTDRQLPLGFLVGVIVQAHRRSEQLTQEDSAQDFSKFIMVLSIIYLKYADELAVFVSDFDSIIDTLSKKKLLPKLTLSELKKLEIETLISLDYNLEIDFYSWQRIFHRYISNKIQNSFFKETIKYYTVDKAKFVNSNQKLYDDFFNDTCPSLDYGIIFLNILIASTIVGLVFLLMNTYRSCTSSRGFYLNDVLFFSPKPHLFEDGEKSLNDYSLLRP